MRTTIAAILVALLAAATTAGAHGEAVHLTLVGEDACEDEKTYCFVVSEGDLSQVVPGADIEVTFENEGGIPHNLYATTLDRMDPEHRNTDSSQALAGTDTIGDGQSEIINFTVPQSADGVYFWCDVPGHEQMGMYLSTSGDDGGGDGGSSPGPGALALAAILFSMAIMARRGGGGA